MKPIVWLGSTKHTVREFPDRVRKKIGDALRMAQSDLKHVIAKPLKGYRGVLEIVCPYMGDTYRTIYAVKLGNKLYVLHIFMKKSKRGVKTPKPDLAMISERLKQAQKLAKEEK